jgi:hypothetical protein
VGTTGFELDTLATGLVARPLEFISFEGKPRPGDVLEFSPERLSQLISPLGTVYPRDRIPARPRPDKSRISLEATQAGFNVPLEELLGQAKGVCSGIVMNVNATLVEVRLDFSATATFDATEALRPLIILGIPEGVPYEYSHLGECSITGGADVVVDLSSGCVLTMNLAAVLDAEEHATLAAEWTPPGGSDPIPEVGFTYKWDGDLLVKFQRGSAMN